ncbi:MAG: chromosome segregation protein SMC, partial [Ruminiclostridium sp.]|nr:chromosome segregation protein SMC [Ruminiclostridium sp.]
MARKGLDLIEREKSLYIGISVWDIDRIGKEIIEADNNILANQGQCEHYEREITQLEEEQEEISRKKMELTAKREELRRKGEQARDELAAAEKEQAVLENEITHCNENIAQIQQRIKDGEQGAEELNRRIEQLSREVEEKKNQIAQNEEKTKELGGQLSAMSGESKDLDNEYKDLDRKQGELLAEKTRLTLTLQSAQQNITSLQETLASSKESFEAAEDKIKELRTKRRELSDRLTEIGDRKLEADNKLKGYGKLFETKSSRLKEQQQQFEQLRLEYQQSKSRLDVLSDVEKNMAGYASSVKAVITASRQGRIGGIEGTVADVIRVDKRFGTAVEIALGGALQNIIVNNEETAKRCIRYLKESGGGRATFLPLTSIKGNLMDSGYLQNEEGFEGIASELVECNEKYRSIIRFILGRCAVVE